VWAPDARRFEGGSANVTGIHALGASIDLLLAAGVDRVWAHVEALCGRLRAGLDAGGATVLSDGSPAGRSGIVSFVLDGHDPATVVAHLEQRGVVCSPRAGAVRVSPHGYNTIDDVDRLVEAVAAQRGAGPRPR